MLHLPPMQKGMKVVAMDSAGRATVALPNAKGEFQFAKLKANQLYTLR